VTVPISAADTITLAFQHTKRQLFQPFRFWQWTRLAIVGLLAGEMGSGGGFNSSSPFRNPHSSPSLPHIDPTILAALISILVVTGFIFLIVMTYVSSVMRFVLFDAVLTKECHIRAGWTRRQGPGWKYFLWQLGFGFVTLAAFVVVVGVPAAVAFAMGWFSPARDHVLALVLGGVVVFVLFFSLVVIAAVVHVLTKDFVVPQMALEGVGSVEGWRRLWSMIQLERGSYAMYVVLKVLLSIGAGIIIGVISIVVGLLFAIPAVGVAIAAVLMGKTAGLTWNVLTITTAVVVGCILLAILLYLIALIAVPAIVFFPAYSIYFFAARYRPLSAALYPPPDQAMPTGGPPPEEPPPLLPAPAL
jgi:hypothetical protein